MTNLRAVMGFLEAFFTVWIPGMTAVVGATWAMPPLMAWLIITAGGALAGIRHVNALLSTPDKKEGP